MISEKHFDRIQELIDPEKTIFGGNTDRALLKIEPTLLSPATFDDPVMQEEIFGPLLPIVTFDTLDEAIRKINSMQHLLPKPKRRPQSHDALRIRRRMHQRYDHSPCHQ